MALTYEQERALLQQKNENIKEVMKIKHQYTMEELEKQFEIAKINAMNDD